MIKKNFIVVVLSLFLLNQVNLFALQNKESLNQDNTSTEKKVPNVNVSSKKGWGIGIEAGYNWELYQDDLDIGPGHITAPSTWRAGITVARGKPTVVGLPRRTQVTSVGFIFMENFAENLSGDPSVDYGPNTGWGIYANTVSHINFKLGKDNNYFYTGFGFGLDIYIYDSNRADYTVQFARIPMGFKFLMRETMELFFEGTFYLGMRASSNLGDDPWYNGTVAHYGTSIFFDMGVEAKGGVRFWF